ncbi:uncharacterized protein LOC141678802 [Apium graveolens]|uniref:uncharacterized protein LOC141678802 n=1 Tax=Apium graveolens TaxID=4045 RepID=UPI003D78BD31
MYPVAFAVVESENTESWKWFLGLLRDDLELGNGQTFTVISDQQKDLINAMKELLPRAEHRLCKRHLYNNFRKRFPQGTVKHCFWTAACATYPALFHKAMEMLLRISKKAHEELDNLDPNSWSKAFFQKHSFADNVENNMSECFNNWIINERFMPLLTMIQDIHFKIMRRIRVNREQMCSSDQVICPRIKAKLDAAVKLSRKWQATWDGESKYMVRYGTKSVTVNLDVKTCDCRAWELTGIPCPHAVAAIYDRRHQPLAYVSHYYTREMYLKAYTFSLPVLRGEDFWEMTGKALMLPPDMPKKLRGRPKKLRRREDWEGGSGSRCKGVTVTASGLQKMTSGKKMHCSNCRKAGHKKTKCPDLQVPKEGPKENENVTENENSAEPV